MAQHDYEILNQTFPLTRQDINNLAAAVVTNNSGASEPTTMYNYQWWFDTNTNTLKFRNADNDAWISFATFDMVNDTVNLVDSAVDIVTDLSPQLGANLDLNSNDITGTGNINITGTATVSGDLTVDTDTLYVDSSSNRVGIGTDSPAGDLSVEGTNVEAFFIGTGNSRLQLKAGNTSNSFIEFGDTDDSNVGRFLYAHADNSMRFDVNATEAMRISSNQNIGIKNSIPDTFNQFANALVVGSGSSNSGITIYSGTANDGNLNFADGTSGNSLFAGFLTYDHSEDAMKFFVNYAGSTSPRMTINSSGNLLVGKTADNLTDAGQVFTNGGSSFTRSGGATCQFNRNTNDGEIVRFSKDGTTVGSIGVSSSDNLYIAGSVASHAGLNFGTNQIIPYSGGSPADNTVDLGNNSNYFKDVLVKGGIRFGTLNSADYLDDYEEGTFTVTYVPQTSGSVTLLGGENELSYVKVGNIVHVSGRIRVDSVSSPVGLGNIFSLPFAVDTLTDKAEEGMGVAMFFGTTSSVSPVGSIRCDQGQVKIILEAYDGTTHNFDSNQLQANTGFRFSFTYRSV